MSQDFDNTWRHHIYRGINQEGLYLLWPELIDAVLGGFLLPDNASRWAMYGDLIQAGFVVDLPGPGARLLVPLEHAQGYVRMMIASGICPWAP